jgi:hypothetical protein
MSLTGGADNNSPDITGDDSSIVDNLTITDTLYFKPMENFYQGYNAPVIKVDDTTGDMILNLDTQANVVFSQGISQTAKLDFLKVNPSTGITFTTSTNTSTTISYNEFACLDGCSINIADALQSIPVDASLVHIAGTEVITGQKTFTNAPFTVSNTGSSTTINSQTVSISSKEANGTVIKSVAIDGTETTIFEISPYGLYSPFSIGTTLQQVRFNYPMLMNSGAYLTTGVFEMYPNTTFMVRENSTFLCNGSMLVTQIDAYNTDVYLYPSMYGTLYFGRTDTFFTNSLNLTFTNVNIQSVSTFNNTVAINSNLSANNISTTTLSIANKSTVFGYTSYSSGTSINLDYGQGEYIYLTNSPL